MTGCGFGTILKQAAADDERLQQEVSAFMRGCRLCRENPRLLTEESKKLASLRQRNRIIPDGDSKALHSAISQDPVLKENERHRCGTQEMEEENRDGTVSLYKTGAEVIPPPRFAFLCSFNGRC